jgi:hypothetical protein
LAQDRIVAIGLLTDDDLSRLGDAFTRVWPVEDSAGFEDLLAAIDEAQERLEQECRVPQANSGE